MNTVVRIAVFISALWAHSSGAQQLPDPPLSIELSQPVTLHLELIVNQRSTGNIIPIAMVDGHFQTDSAYLHDADIQLPEQMAGRVNIDELTGVKVVYNEAYQRLHLEVPTSWSSGILSNHRISTPPQ